MLILVKTALNASIKDHVYNEIAFFLEAKFPADWIALFQEFSWKNPFD